MNLFKDNPQQIGLNSRQLDLYQDVYVITEDGSWSEDPRTLIGYMEVEGDICAVCRDSCAETRIRHWGTWCPVVEPQDGSGERSRVNTEELARLDEAVDSMVEKILSNVHGADDPSLHADKIINGCGDDGEIPTKYVVLSEDDHVVGVYVDESYAEAHMKACLGRIEGWIGDEVVCTCEFIYSAEAFIEDSVAVPTGTLWTRYERESLDVH